jgi:hypothetical protein
MRSDRRGTGCDERVPWDGYLISAVGSGTSEGCGERRTIVVRVCKRKISQAAVCVTIEIMVMLASCYNSTGKTKEIRKLVYDKKVTFQWGVVV